MGKNIKVIKCPQCGSVQKEKLEEDHYLCKNCGTEYFLDNDDITIHHDIKDHRTPIDFSKLLKIILPVIGGIILLNILFSLLFKSTPTPNYNTYENETPEVVKEKKVEVWNTSSSESYISSEGRPVVFVIGDRRIEGNYQYSETKDLYLIFYDLLSGKEIKRSKLDLGNRNVKDMARKVSIETFEDGKPYFILDKRWLFSIDTKYLKANEITANDYEKFSEFESGFAKVEFISRFGSGLNIMNNEGKTYYFYPLAGKIFNSDTDFYKGRTKTSSLPNAAPIKTGFQFSDKSFDFPNEDIQLIKYRFKDSLGYPRENVRFEWTKDYGRAGIFTGGEPYTKRLINEYMRQQARIIDFKDFTPGRKYFSSDVEYFDQNELLILFYPSPVNDGSPSLQLMDAQTGKIKWTKSYDINDIKKVIKYKGGFVLKMATSKFLVLNEENGEKITSFNYEELKQELDD